jgi:nucleoside 2-deoxyribosyltransferase
MSATRDQVYLAGPMFSVGEKSEQLALARALEKDFDVHLPQRDGIEVAAVMGLLRNPKLNGIAMLEAPLMDRFVTWATRTVVALDIFQAVEGCQCVVLNIDGRVPDEGAIVEATAAWYAGRPVVPFKTTPVTELGINSNPMVDAITRWAPPIDDVTRASDAVRAALRKRPAIDMSLIPTEIQELCELGRIIWETRKRGLLTRQEQVSAEKRLVAAAPALRSVIEPVHMLQKRAFVVVIATIELSKLGPENPTSHKVVKRLIRDMKAWGALPGVRSAILRNPSTA